MLDNFDRYRRKIEHLTPLHPHLDRIAEPPTASVTHPRFVTNDPVWHRDLLEAGTRMPRLPARLPNARLT